MQGKLRGNASSIAMVRAATDSKSCSNRTSNAGTMQCACIDNRFEQDLRAAARLSRGHVPDPSRPHAVFGGALSRALTSDWLQTCRDVVWGSGIMTCNRGDGPKVRFSAHNPTASRTFANVAIDCKSPCRHKSCSNRSRNTVHKYGACYD